MEAATRKPYPSDLSDEEWHFMLPYLTRRRHDLREGFDALRRLVRAGARRACLPHEFPAWTTVCQQARR